MFKIGMILYVELLTIDCTPEAIQCRELNISVKLCSLRYDILAMTVDGYRTNTWETDMLLDILIKWICRLDLL